MKVLIADDDPQLVRALRITLGARGYDVITAADGAQALRLAADDHPDLLIVDLGMPKLDGVSVIEGLRGWSTMPILVVSGRSGSDDKVDALDAGADDYVTKPFQIDELLARVRALTRRGGTSEVEAVVCLSGTTVDVAAKTVTAADGSRVRLTPTEWRILEVLIRGQGRLVTREMLLTDIWGPNHVADSGYLRLYVSQLRKKLEPEPARPRHLLTESGMGYRLVVDPPG